jgi:hypothetical protein
MALFDYATEGAQLTAPKPDARGFQPDAPGFCA